MHASDSLCISRVSQARLSFYSSAESPRKGLLPHELPGCIARAACDKYRNVEALSHGAKVRAFVHNLLGLADEHEVLQSVPAAPPIPGRTSVAAGPTANDKARKLAAASLDVNNASLDELAGRSPPANAPGAAAIRSVDAAEAAAAACASAMLGVDGFFEGLDTDGAGVIILADLLEAIGLHHPTMAEALLGGTGTLLYKALDTHGDGTLSRDELPGMIAQAVIAQPNLLSACI